MYSTILKKMSKYSKIKTADELQAAIKDVRSEIKSQERILAIKYDGLREHYTPTNMVAGFLKKNSDYYNWADMSLHIVKTLKSKVARKKPEPPHRDEWLGDIDETRIAEEHSGEPEEKKVTEEIKDAAKAFMSEVKRRVDNDEVV